MNTWFEYLLFNKAFEAILHKQLMAFISSDLKPE